jgi:hypothetical protein
MEGTSARKRRRVTFGTKSAYLQLENKKDTSKVSFSTFVVAMVPS